MAVSPVDFAPGFSGGCRAHPEPGAVDVWWSDAEPEAAPSDAPLDDEERRRADRFINPLHRRRFIQAHTVLRRVLAAYGAGAPESLVFVRDEDGKPRLTGAGPRFNLSHSGDGVAVAVADFDVGVDVEQVRPLADRDHLVARFFSPAENAAYEALSPDRRQLAFFRLWTRKEAYLKALGTGLRVSLDSFSVSNGTEAELIDPAGSDWRLADLDLGADWAGAVAGNTAGPLAVRVLRYRSV